MESAALSRQVDHRHFKNRGALHLRGRIRSRAREGKGQMKVPFLLAWLSGLAPNRLKSEALLFEELLRKADSHPLLPPLEVLPSEVSKTKSFTSDTVSLEGGLTLLKCRVHSGDLSNWESTAGTFEGGLKLSKCAIELVNTLRREIQDGQLSFRGKRVLELGCGHGMPGIFACLKGAAVVHFQDLSAEVLRNVTIPNVIANLEHAQLQSSHLSDASQVTTRTSQRLRPDLRYYAGDWLAMDNVLSLVRQDDADSASNSDESQTWRSDYDSSMESSRQFGNDKATRTSSIGHASSKRALSGSRACERGNSSGSLEGGYDIILMSETVYSALSLPKLYSLVMKCLRPRYGVMYLAGKKHYYGSGGGTRQFKSIADADDFLGAHLVGDITDASFNVREVWKFFFH